MVTFLNKEGEMLPGVVCCVPVKKETIFSTLGLPVIAITAHYFNLFRSLQLKGAGLMYSTFLT